MTCQQCRREPVTHGHVICSNCAIRTLKATCTHPWRPELIILRASNGYERPMLRCRRCYATLSYPKRTAVDLSAADGRIVNEAPGACARCGRADGAERHHWAPVHLFNDADDWPTSLLCPGCHRLWHVITGTAGTAQPR